MTMLKYTSLFIISLFILTFTFTAVKYPERLIYERNGYEYAGVSSKNSTTSTTTTKGRRNTTSTTTPPTATTTPPTATTTPPTVTTCTSFTYSAWSPSTCTTGTQTRTVLTSSPSGCTGGTPIITQTCTVPPVATTTPPVATTTTGEIHVCDPNTYYIDYQNGNDSNTGRCSDNAWKRAPGMNGFAGVYTHIAGDKFVFRGGVTWPNETLPLLITKGGSSDTVRDYYGVDKRWYIGNNWSRPIFDSEGKIVGTNNVEIDLRASGISWITIDNFEFKGHYWSGPTIYGKNITISVISGGLVNGIIIENNYFHGWSHAPYQSAFGTTTDDYWVIRSQSVGIPVSNIVRNNIFDGGDTDKISGGAIKGWGTFSNNIIHDMSNVYVGPGIIINNNTMYDIHNSFDPLNHMNNIEAWLSSGGGATTQYIYNNIIHDTDGGVYNPLGPGFGISGTSSVYYYNNIVWNAAYPIPLVVDTSCAGFVCTPEQVSYHIWNNTLSGPAGYSFCLGFTDRNNGNIGVFDFRNNHCIAETGIYKYGAVLANTLIDNNNILINHANAFSQGYEIVNRFSPISAFGNTVNVGEDLSAYCLSVPGLCKDIKGTARPQGSAWDIGAYEYTGI